MPPAFSSGIKKDLGEKFDIATSPSRWWDLLVGLIASRLLLNTFNVFLGDNQLNRDSLEENKPKQGETKEISKVLQDLKVIYSGLGWVDNMELPIISRLYTLLVNYIDFSSYYFLSKISGIPLDKINYRRIMAEKFGTNWGYTIAWNYILKELGFGTKIYSIEGDNRHFVTKEYVILFGKSDKNEVYLLTPFYAKKTNKVDNLYCDKITEFISTEIKPVNSKYTLVNIDDSNEKVIITVSNKLSNQIKMQTQDDTIKFVNTIWN